MKRDEFYNIRVSIYDGVKDIKGHVGTIEEFLGYSESYAKQIGDVRRETDHHKRSKLKEKLPQAAISAIMPQGRGTYKADDDPVKEGKAKAGDDKPWKHTGLMCVDIDPKDNPTLDVATMKQMMCSIRQVLYCSQSVSGKGVYAIIRIANPEHHAAHYRALERNIKSRFDIKIDPAYKNPKQLRCVSEDPHPYFNFDAEPFIIEDDEQTGKQTRSEAGATSPVSFYPYGGELTKAETYVDEIERLGVDIAPDRDTWVKIGFALHTLGEHGKTLFKRISHLWSMGKTTDKDIDNLWRSAKDGKSRGITMGTFYEICKSHGIRPLSMAAPSRESMFDGLDVELDDEADKTAPEYKDDPNWQDKDNDDDDM